jgi:hypothetical protein
MDTSNGPSATSSASATATPSFPVNEVTFAPANLT